MSALCHSLLKLDSVIEDVFIEIRQVPVDFASAAYKSRATNLEPTHNINQLQSQYFKFCWSKVSLLHDSESPRRLLSAVVCSRLNLRLLQD
jgi:hypothetical protein